LTERNIPGFTLNRQNCELQQELAECIGKVIRQGKFILGENVNALENIISSYCDTSHGIGVANGSDALYLSLIACGVGYEDEVITTPFTFFATAGAISRVGAKPVFVDIHPETWNMDANLIEEKITLKTKAIISVHLYGCPADMHTITQVAKKYNLRVIEDAAQALGAKFKAQKVGSFGDAGCLSFFPTKNLGSFGDAGMIVTNHPELAEKIRILRVHGARSKYYHDFLGYNSRLDELQAAILNVKFKYFEQWTQRRREIANLYHGLFNKHFSADRSLIKLPHEPDDTNHVYHQYTIQTSQRNQLHDYLKNNGVGSTVYYPLPLHLQKVFSALGYRQGDFPVAEAACNEVLSLPMFPELTNEEVAQVVYTVANYFD
jgi:dTDP-4-amino-4,6-dideoxygalactose transaminase